MRTEDGTQMRSTSVKWQRIADRDCKRAESNLEKRFTEIQSQHTQYHPLSSQYHLLSSTREKQAIAQDKVPLIFQNVWYNWYARNGGSGSRENKCKRKFRFLMAVQMKID